LKQSPHRERVVIGRLAIGTHVTTAIRGNVGIGNVNAAATTIESRLGLNEITAGNWSAVVGIKAIAMAMVFAIPVTVRQTIPVDSEQREVLCEPCGANEVPQGLARWSRMSR